MWQRENSGAPSSSHKDTDPTVVLLPQALIWVSLPRSHLPVLGPKHMHFGVHTNVQSLTPCQHTSEMHRYAKESPSSQRWRQGQTEQRRQRILPWKTHSTLSTHCTCALTIEEKNDLKNWKGVTVVPGVTWPLWMWLETCSCITEDWNFLNQIKCKGTASHPFFFSPNFKHFILYWSIAD